MKGYMNTILSQLTSTASAEFRDTLVAYRRSFRKSLATKMLANRRSYILRYQPSFTIDGVDVYIHSDSLYVWAFGVVGAIGTLILNPEEGRPYQNKIDVYHDEAFTLLSDQMRSAIIAHEVGHYKLGHNQKALDGHRPDAKEAFEWELAADKWAFEQGFNIKDALSCMMQSYRKSLRADELKSLRQRIMHIHQLELEKDIALSYPIARPLDDIKIPQMKS